MVVHFTPSYLLNPQHKITVNLIGLGGTGSQVLTCLARMNQALLGLGHPGLHVRGFDGDVVTVANLGRQLFASAEVGMNKAVAMITRTNRFFCTAWEAVPEMYSPNALQVTEDGEEDGAGRQANLTISCVDSAAARLEIARVLYLPGRTGMEPYQARYYWMDFGNGQRTGQVVLGTVRKLEQPKSQKYQTAAQLPTVHRLFDLKKVKEVDQGPSCSLAEALRKQDLFINSTLAQLGVGILWKLFREGVIRHHGCYLNLDSLNVNPIAIQK